MPNWPSLAGWIRSKVILVRLINVHSWQEKKTSEGEEDKVYGRDTVLFIPAELSNEMSLNDFKLFFYEYWNCQNHNATKATI
jgi:hypothetical protein